MTNGHFEAKKHAYRQTQDGVVISFVVHPNDVQAAIATAPLGTRYMVGFAEIGDDDRPVAQRTEHKTPTLEVAGSTPAGPTKERRPFNTLPLSQQAAIRCQDRDFQRFIVENSAGSITAVDADGAAVMVRARCRVQSRSELDVPDSVGAALWKRVEDSYQAWLTEQMYPAEVRR